MKRWNLPIALYMFLVFISGGVVGALGYRMYSPPAAHTEQRLNPEAWRKKYMDELNSRVNLTPEQVQKMNALLDQSDASFTAARNQHHEAVEKIKEDHRARVRGLLTADQLPKYEQFNADMDARAKAYKK
ncbi:MAG TPA: hypothetical protein VKT81_01640 [Bryobacteraceae bacterium]|nr:hypothetical protein [Bryobacteraceae bacterium]